MIKAVIPVAGVGTRLRPHTHTQPKPLIPVAGVPILGHIIDNLVQNGIRDFVFIIGHLGEKIEAFVEERYADKINIEFVVQSPRIGLGHAIWSAKAEIQKADEVLIVLGDTIFDLDLGSFLKMSESVVGVQEVEDPRNFGVAELDDEGYLLKAVEKPNIPKSNLALVGLYKVKEIAVFMKALDQLLAGEPSETGEYHLTEAFQAMIGVGVKIRSVRVDNWFDCGKKETLLHANRVLLERITKISEYNFANTVILPPVQISFGASIENSIIGPYVSIDENAVIRDSIVKNSILGAYSTLDSIVLDNSVIGSDATMRGHSHSVNIGDNTEIDFNE